MNQQIQPKTAAMIIALAVILVLAVGWYVMNRPKRLSYPANFNPAAPPAGAPSAPTGR